MGLEIGVVFRTGVMGVTGVNGLITQHKVLFIYTSEAKKGRETKKSTANVQMS